MMLSAPVSENKTKEQQGKAESEFEMEGDKRSGGWAGYGSLSPGSGRLAAVSQVMGKQAVMQKAYGNQAMLRMMGRSPVQTPVTASPLSRGGILQRKCACGNTAGSSGSCAECQEDGEIAVPGSIQTKLTINEPGDRYEQEADRVADQVLATPTNSIISGAPPRIQRFTGQTTGRAGMAAPASVDHVLSSPGRPLEPSLQQDMEQRFDHDFSSVRVHTGAAAERSAREVNANAYTVGHNIVFGAGRYAPVTHEGRRLLAHELTHTVQQNAARNLDSDVKREQLSTVGSRLVQRDGESNVPTLDELYNNALQAARQTGGTLWQDVAEKLNGFNHEDIQSRLAQLTQDEIGYIHQGALSNPQVGPDSQVAQLTKPGTPLASTSPPQATTIPATPEQTEAPAPSSTTTQSLDTPSQDLPASDGGAANGGSAAQQQQQNDECIPSTPLKVLPPDMGSLQKLTIAIGKGLVNVPKNEIKQLPRQMAGIVFGLLISASFGPGEIITLLGVAWKGFQMLKILDDITNFTTIAIGAQTCADLDKAGEQFSQAVIDTGLLVVIEKIGELSSGKGVAENDEPLPQSQPQGSNNVVPDGVSGTSSGTTPDSVSSGFYTEGSAALNYAPAQQPTISPESLPTISPANDNAVPAESAQEVIVPVMPVIPVAGLKPDPCEDCSENNWRKYNPEFMQEKLKRILSNPNHPLKFLVDYKTRTWQSRSNQNEAGVHAGHRVNRLGCQLGWGKLSLAVEEGWQNIYDSSTDKILAVSKGTVTIEGVEVDYGSALQWMRQGLLKNIDLDTLKMSDEGWKPSICK